MNKTKRIKETLKEYAAFAEKALLTPDFRGDKSLKEYAAETNLLARLEESISDLRERRGLQEYFDHQELPYKETHFDQTDAISLTIFERAAKILSEPKDENS